MSNLIRRLFRGGGGESLELGPFQMLVLDVVQRRFPDRSWAATEDPDVIRCGSDWRLGLQNLYADDHDIAES